MAAASAEAKKILSSLPLMAYDLGELFASKKASTLLSLQVPTVPPSLPYFLCDLPAPAFAAVVALCEAGQLSFTTVGAQEGKISLIGAKPRCPLLTLDAQPGIQYLLPMRLVAGVVPGAAGGGGAGRFFSAGAAGTAFRWNEPAAGKAAAKGRAKPAAAAKDSKKGKVVAPKKKPVAAKRPAKPAAKPAKPAVKPVKPAVKSAVKSAAKPAGGRKR